MELNTAAGRWAQVGPRRDASGVLHPGNPKGQRLTEHSRYYVERAGDPNHASPPTRTSPLGA